MRFDDKVVLVSGGSSGIGPAAAMGIAADGASVFISGRDRMPRGIVNSAQHRRPSVIGQGLRLGDTGRCDRR